jgi:UDP-2-acetamido-2,6-beta-L-arabino-hexul-4-ose reductase
MVIGNGLVARMLEKFDVNDHILIFASGVSNSGENSDTEYKRESDLLLSKRGTKARLVYFSTCSMFDPTLQEGKYVKHKRAMEEMIASEFHSHLILRLPLLISNAPNPYTFFNFMSQRIRQGTPIPVHSNAWRYLMDASDLSFWIPILIKRSVAERQTINMAYDNAAKVTHIISLMEEIVGVKANKELVERGSYYDFDRTDFRGLIKEVGFPFDPETYNLQILRKYLELEREGW